MQGHYDHPKGHIEKGETEEETCVREIQEEAGLDAHELEFVHGFRETLAYDVEARPGLRKVVTYFLVRVPEAAEVRGERTLSPFLGHTWVPIPKARRLTERCHSRELLRRVHSFLLSSPSPSSSAV
jgi:8-oxo-dGTP pyrophosphatase MutT (NUDIX family)